MTAITTRIWTIGHSNLDWPKFARLLEIAQVAILADVRSSPLSRMAHFNQTSLKARLNASGVAYIFMGAELGGRPARGEPADYEQMAREPLFEAGLSRVEETAARGRLALMCSEHEPLECHRCLLVGRRLVERGKEVAHILRDGRIEPHETTEDRLLKLTRQTADDLLETRADRLCRAYRNQNHRICRLGVKQSASPAPSR